MKKFIISVSLILLVTSIFATVFVLSQNNEDSQFEQPTKSTNTVTLDSSSDSIEDKTDIDKLVESENTQDCDDFISDNIESSEIKDIIKENVTEDKNIITATAEYAGQIDNNSIEVIINDTYKSLRIKEVQHLYHSLNLDLGDTLIAKYYTNEHGQNIV
ncbi:hypothetical protein RBH29_17675, partial [Herbivorax sp. ANBcel31]|uniref:hypothetical protein n=1 Tax=Herbivorax sp. ANBcel31 TaxID=3069754 RepID=UPI0027B034DE